MRRRSVFRPQFSYFPYSVDKAARDTLKSLVTSVVVRVAGLVGFNRGKASSSVSELAGRDPETRKVDESRIPKAYDKLEAALIEITSKYQFENFVMLIKSADFISSKLINSENALHFAYGLYLKLRQDKTTSERE